MVQIIRGELGGFALLDLPREVGPVLLLAFLLSALWSVVAYARRPGGQHFVSQWSIVGATFGAGLVFPGFVWAGLVWASLVCAGDVTRGRRIDPKRNRIHLRNRFWFNCGIDDPVVAE